ncbi:MAG: hypothetical protein GX573_21480 [Chloroflexi bacterium]|nr:hypothetical protein [Chloroflexota bacterium]
MKKVYEAIQKASNAALIVGAGISYDMGIPLGYQFPMQFGETHQSLLNRLDILKEWQTAWSAADSRKWELEEQFVQVLIREFKFSMDLQQALLDWLMSYQSSSGSHAGEPVFMGQSSDVHAAFVIAWLKRIFKHLVTTNWDFLLEWHVDTIYQESYADPFEPATYTFDNGLTCAIDSNRLFFLESLEGDDYFWTPRWDIVANVSDLPNLKRWTRPIWKIHGSPFFLACPRCGGFSRWKRTTAVKVNDPCPEHPHEKLLPEIVFWGQGIDQAHPQVWSRVKARLERSDLIIASGFSGSGSDVYIRNAVERHPNAWVINPSRGAWDVSRVNYVEAKASELVDLLLTQFVTK